jgi:hypothetical protein
MCSTGAISAPTKSANVKISRSNALAIAYRNGLYDNPAHGVYILNERGWRFLAEQGVELDWYTTDELSAVVLALAVEVCREHEQLKLI